MEDKINNTGSKGSSDPNGTPLAYGASAGTLFGIIIGSITDNMGLWLCVGICVGLALGAVFTKKRSD